MAIHDNVAFTAEVLPTRVRGTPTGAITFLAYYAELSWRPGGEVRPYTEETGTLGRVRMSRRYAWEVSARFSHTGLTSGSQDGGVLDLPSLSLGVFGPSSSRLLLDYGFSVLRKAGVTGRTSLVTLRFQWELR
jgi:hypothetical protein